jgi:hypothetical protein
MAGLVPAIHVGVRRVADGCNWSAAILKPPRPVTTWMPGTSPGMTRITCIHRVYRESIT